MSQTSLNRELDRSVALINWLIFGMDIHCIPTYLWKSVTIEWVEENYNKKF
jgi:hypothetical protein